MGNREIFEIRPPEKLIQFGEEGNDRGRVQMVPVSIPLPSSSSLDGVDEQKTKTARLNHLTIVHVGFRRPCLDFRGG